MHVTQNTINHVAIDKPIQYEKWPVEVQDFMKIIHHSRRIYRLYLKRIKKNRKIPTCNYLDLEKKRFVWLCPNVSPDTEFSIFTYVVSRKCTICEGFG